MSVDLRAEALNLLDTRGTILDTARELSASLRKSGIKGCVIGGVAVVLHRYVRTTVDVDLLIDGPPQSMKSPLVACGFVWHARRREFGREGVMVHLVQPEQVGWMPTRFVEIEDVLTVTLADLITMKLRSGTKSLLRAFDLAGVIGLIRRNRLTSTFASRLSQDVRPDFRKIVKAIERETA